MMASWCCAPRRFAVFASILLVFFPGAKGEVTLPKVLGDNMVLQRDQAVPIWGRAAAGEEVIVRFAGQEKHAKGDAQGNWRVHLDSLPASAEPREMTISGTSNTLQLRNLFVGEVWLCSGQSNMEMAVGILTAGAQPAAKSDAALAEDVQGEGFPDIRLFKVEKLIQPPDVVSNGWNECRGDALAQFSAIGYIFARELQRELKVPVGMIQAAWGGSRIEPWTPPEAYAGLSAFEKEAASQPLTIDGVTPGKNYNGMVRPLVPFAIRGVLWYQGESNIIEGNDGLRYADKMQALITGWRAAWSQRDLPFFHVQLAPFAYSGRTKDKVAHSETALPELWEAQSRALKIPHTGMVPTTDLAQNLRDIHPQQKRGVAERLAKLALAEVYGQTKLVHGGPMFEKLETHGEKAVVHFRQIGSGLKSRDGQPLTHFEIAGADGNFTPAEAAIEGENVVVVSSSQVTAPKAVRFGWNETAQPNLINAEGWPAFPFRSNGPEWNPQPVMKSPAP